MNLDEARRILRGQPGCVDELGADYVRHARAAEVLGDHYRANPHLLRPLGRLTTDATPKPAATEKVISMTPPPKPHPDMPPMEYVAAMSPRFEWEESRKRTRDAERGPDWAAALRRAQTRDENLSGMGKYSFTSTEQTPMGKSPEAGAVGAEMVMELEGDDPGAYFVGPKPNGLGAALYRHVSTPPLNGVTTTDFRKFADQSAKRQQKAMRSIAQRARDFWSTNAA